MPTAIYTRARLRYSFSVRGVLVMAPFSKGSCGRACALLPRSDAVVIGQGTRLAVAGMIVGVIAALGLSRLVEGMLFGIAATDPIAFGAVLTLTLAAVLVASYLPARRAIRVTPVVALRTE